MMSDANVEIVGQRRPVAQDIAILWTLRRGRVTHGKQYLHPTEARRAAGLDRESMSAKRDLVRSIYANGNIATAPSPTSGSLRGAHDSAPQWRFEVTAHEGRR